MKRELQLLNVMSALFVFALGLLGPIYATYVAGIGGDMITTGTAYSIFAIASGALTFLLSRWENRSKHKARIMMYGFALGCIGILGYLFVSNPLELFAVQLVLGIAAAIRMPLYDALYSTYLDKGKYTAEWGAWEALNLIVTGLSALLGGMIAEWYGFNTLFALMFAVSLIGFFMSAALPTKKPKKRPRK